MINKNLYLLLVSLFFIFCCSQAIFANKWLNEKSYFKCTNINQGILADTQEGLIFIIPNNGYQITDQTLTKNAELNTASPGIEKLVKTKALLCYNDYNSYSLNRQNNTIQIVIQKAIDKEILSNLNYWEDLTKKMVFENSPTENIEEKNIGNIKNIKTASLSFVVDITKEYINPLIVSPAQIKNDPDLLQRFKTCYVFRYKKFMFIIEGNCKVKNKTELIKDIESIIKSIK